MDSQVQQFQHELNAMRKAVDGFGRAYPTVASELRLSAGHSADPHVEQLLQSFAWLTSQLRCDMEQQRHEMPNHLLLSLYPNLLRSIPCMAVLKANVMLAGANFVNGHTLEKGRLFSTTSVARRSGSGNEDRQVECRMQCCYDTPLWPFVLEDVALKPRNSFAFLDDLPRVQTVISIRLRSEGAEPIYEYPLERLRFFIADPAVRARLQMLLSGSFAGCALRVGERSVVLPDSRIEWLGFAREHNVLPRQEAGHDGYRLLQEYFHFPEKFHFFEVCGLDMKDVTNEFELLLLLDSSDAQLSLSRHSLAINSFPVINLFPTTFKPLQLDYSEYEYRLLADESQYGQSEVHSVDEVRLIAPDGRVTHSAPWVGEAAAPDTTLAGKPRSDLRYILRLIKPLAPKLPGCDTMIALYDGNLLPGRPVDQTISVRGLCSNRNLPESLRVGDRLKLIGAGAMLDSQVISNATLFKSARLDGQTMVSLLSQLHLNHRQLMDEGTRQRALDNFRRLLHMYSDPLLASHRSQIDGIVDMKATPAVRRTGKDHWRGHYRGTCLTLVVEESSFDGANPLLLGEVLSHFLGLYTTMNHFVQLQMMSYQREGIWKQWLPRIGEQVTI